MRSCARKTHKNIYYNLGSPQATHLYVHSGHCKVYTLFIICGVRPRSLELGIEAAVQGHLFVIYYHHSTLDNGIVLAGFVVNASTSKNTSVLNHCTLSLLFPVARTMQSMSTRLSNYRRACGMLGLWSRKLWLVRMSA